MGSCLTGYGFSRFRVRERNTIFMLMLSTMMVPYMVTLVPLYLIVSKIGLTDKRWFWIIWGFQGLPFLIFLFRQYFSTIPISFEESATLDGAGRFQIFFLIMFPLVQTAVIIAAIFAFQWSWSNYLMPVLFLRGEKVTLAVKLANGYTDIKQNILHHVGMAGIVYYTLPIIIVFFALQRRFIAGLLSGGLKG
jgi:ABC-type glycerol-3-phosphate transport system permease component